MTLRMRLVSFVFLFLAVAVPLSAWALLQLPRFGSHPQGTDAGRLLLSSHFVDGAFRNVVDTPMFAQGRGFWSMLWDDLTQPAPTAELQPAHALPVIKTDLKALDLQRDTVVWLGHSAYFVVLGGQRLLVDPVFNTYAAPVSFANRAFEGTTLYAARDLPPLDALLITHDHWDHLDQDTVLALAAQVQRFIVPLGVGAHLKHWGIGEERITELDWYGDTALGTDLHIHAVPARHFSGRSLRRNQTMWAGYVLESSNRRLLLSGDSGYGPHFADIAQRFSGFDLVALDMGQYDERWPNLHMTPEEAANAAVTLRARRLLPAHIGRFSLARHSWFEPLDRIQRASENKPYQLDTPRIGEPLALDAAPAPAIAWWRDALLQSAI